MLVTYLLQITVWLLLFPAPNHAQQAPAKLVTSPHGNLAVPCQNCHTANGWKPVRTVPEFDHNKTRYPLRGMHEGLACTQCHTKMIFTDVGKTCSNCHADLHRGKMGSNCEQCHNVKGWKVATKDIQNHNNRFPLIGAHAMVQCEDCHKNGGLSQFNTMSTACYSCHAKDYQNTRDVNHVALKLPIECTQCHNQNTWAGAAFDHLRFTGYALTGAHAQLDCALCHVGGRYAGTPTACVGCHLNNFQKSTNPNHVQFNLPQTCEQCHTTAAWEPAKFDHNLIAAFPLTGAHATVACEQCHANNNFTITNTACVSCHMKDFQGTTNPNHVQAGFPQTCEQCHSTTNWQGAVFDHAKTGFALTGAHTTLPCTQCHANGNFSITVTTCVSCHLKDFQGTTAPNHVQANLPQTCEQCHTTTAWTGAKFDHASTGFALTGAHASVQCAQCHVNNNYAITDASCVSCHQKDFSGTTNPNHVQQGFPSTCATCHNTTAWQPATFDHASTGFPLSGAHSTLPCAQCHTNNNYNLTSGACVNCHKADFDGTTNPNHAASGFSTSCELCHSTVNWQGAVFDHSKTGFVLTGAHVTVQCAQCHTNNNYSLTTGACATCHLTDYNGATNPNHATSGFPTTCDSCHSTTNWLNAVFNHASTGFPLTGAHTPLACNQCHTNGNYNLTSTLCSSCHQQDYASTTDPPHAAAKIATTCDTCHSTTNWQGATFNHATTGWALTGAHTTLTCAQCHVNANYTLSSGTCSTCHLPDYQKTTNPNHVTGGFPQTCDQCHNTTAWTGAAFDHSKTGFPLTGAHTSLPCAQCHVNNNYNLTDASCVGCHLTDFQKTTNPNHVTSGFPQTCAQCHNTTAWTGAVFDHATTGFPLTGAHTPLACTQCHVNNNYNLTSTACVTCHQTDYNSTTDPSHTAAKFATTCDSCHSTTNWLGATFNHASTGWALTGAHTSLTCAQCHTNGNYSLTSGACAQCHLTDYNGTTNPNHVTSGLPQTCDSCHTTTAWTGATFNHAAAPANWALTGAHAPLACTQCHVNNNYSLTSTACVTCHQTDYNSTTDPSHTAAKLPTTCDSCHTTTNWLGATFNHSAAPANWPLTGAHAPLTCAQCHVNGNYSLTSGACAQCHFTDYNGTTNPNHVSSGFPQTCDSCHTTTAWTGATFNHAAAPANWALTGAHAPLACTQCHVNNNYSLTSTACVTCHQTDFNSTNNPPHAAAKFPTTCDTCHSTTNWTSATFNHSAAPANWPLTGAHTSLTCAQCHTNNNYSFTSGACVQCHLTDYNGTTNPNHVTSGFPQTCDSCHTTTLWTGATFNHAVAPANWALTGAHASLSCTQCHVNNNYNLTSTVCVTCHQTDYNNAKTPVDHVGANFPTTCDTCHDTVLWTNGKFNHASTGFTLDGFHTSLQCTQCHNAAFGNYNITTNACILCHLTNFNGTTNPPHTGFPSTAQSCVTACHHTTTDWTGASFDHSQAPANWALVGGHTTVACASCHVSNNYSLTAANAANCDFCHDGIFRTATSPNHVTGGFPTTCTTCHVWPKTDWLGASLPSQYHKWFSPSHHGASCGTDCHQNAPTDYAPYQCYVACHHHTKSNTDGNHNGRAGYSYGTNGDTCAVSGCHLGGG
jgi:predicted CXXCH cytochrome family protein